MAGLDKLVLVTRKTRLAELVERFNTRAQARFYIERAGGDFGEYLKEDDTYRRSLEEVRSALELGLKLQVMDRSLVSTYLFTEHDLVIAAGDDGLVANTAKYIGSQPLIGVNVDPERNDGVLMPIGPAVLRRTVHRVLQGQARMRRVTLAQASLNDGQRLLAFNDLFIGARSHVSARYRIRWGQTEEPHSSSGIIVSTGAGSTGWLSSVFNMVHGVASFLSKADRGRGRLRMDWEDPRLAFVVREPFVSKHSQAGVVAGLVEPGQVLRVESLMPSAGVIFSDGIEADFLAFNSGATARIEAAEHRAHLVVG
ncbi:MAG: NAD+ kinase [Candidatus Eremiobacterota bacterium]